MWAGKAYTQQNSNQLLPSGVLYCMCNSVYISHVFVIMSFFCISLNHHTAPCCIRPRVHVTITFMHTITTPHRQFIIFTLGHLHCSFVLYCMIPRHVVWWPTMVAEKGHWANLVSWAEMTSRAEMASRAEMTSWA